ncbi:signal transduction histidine kinase/HAMP domain-containing protein/DNA-binding response OmpR family regulator [Amycolatopsis bartoniae]|uniref:Circadian input-output histidine kinase CikA n=1 Tax=Amycolatopsis bartoniae TaxID=941986 RepID=A0A8H9M2Y0_9PSEU|nr:HAMP domain-containing protein [Amycolatopsis bartoniae]MBB2938341.1 signal transduction histidine kinase/HAMP domain-containing protein/DNA-binding response OmpR family regulator [Amycolatopsis bartoniae]TVT01803.1 HAMP domain-containing protein [Amycolatopsis bartoniae]GHF34467.1 histidine kinase [Amycolatopsis bartoniae]
MTPRQPATRRDTGLAGDDRLQELLDGLKAVRDGDFSRRLPQAGDGLLDEIADVFNGMVDQLALFTSEVTRVAREVGTDGKLGGQASVPAVSGTWKDLTESVNAMAGNLTAQVRDIASVATAVANGDLTQKITVHVKGELLELKNTINTMVGQLSSFADEVTRVAREVGSEGRLGGQAEVPGVAGTWRDLTTSVNFMAGNLTAQVRSIAEVTTAVAKGDLTQKITVDARGEILELKSTINTMVDTLSSFADEVTRVAREVGTEGMLGGQAQVPGVAGTWRDLTTSVNFMAGNLTAQVRSIAQVATAVARGDLSQKITVDARGEILELKNTINTMVDQLSSFADEVTRVAREVGTEGRLGGQADVKGVSGTWKGLTESVNVMADNLTDQVRSIAEVTTAVARGDLSQKIRVDARGEILELKDTINTMVGQLSAFADEVTRVAREVGTEGRLGGQADVKGVSGTWKGLTESVNVMADNLTDQVRSIAQVATAVARGDLGQKITVEAKGEVAALAQTINTMVDTLSAFADEVTRVAREVGTEGILGGQARVPNVAGTWKSLTDNVNSMANNLTNQVRSIAQVTTAVARGDLSQKIDVDARGEILELKTTINTMVDTLSAFAAEVTRVAREVGKEGRLGGQAEVEGVSGTWKRLTENVNELAGNLTRQVRAIAEVASAVATGDLTRSISVEARGEVAELSDNINAMVHSLRETTRANEDQDWLNKNLARISGLLQGHRDLRAVAQLIMNELTPLVGAQHGTFFLMENGDPVLRLIAGYGREATGEVRFDLGQSLIGQVAETKTPIVVEQTPPDYVRISSSLGAAPPANLIVLPIVFEDQVLGVIELASFTRFTPVHRDFLEQLMESIGVNVNTIIANARTDALLDESQRLAEELQTRSGELQAQQVKLQQSNAELEEKAELLVRQNRDIEIKNFEIEQARQEIEERAQQLALASKYKSEFLANMSHELRTPLTSLLILAGVLAQNSAQNLTAKQVEFAKVIQSAGTDLLQLINDILDLSKVEAGKMDIHCEQVRLPQLLEYVRTTFRPLTAEKGLEFEVIVEPEVPARLLTDEQRLRQVLRNLLSNAVKFTEHGRVELRVRVVDAREPSVAFSVRDTGIGIAAENLETIFGAFQQADGTTSRRYGGTGLGLSISRQVANLLGGEIQAQSRLGHGSTFTLTLPVTPVFAVGGAEPKQRGEAESQPRVLVVESPDSTLLTLLVRGFVADLAETGEQVLVESAGTPDEAVAALAARGHRCVVLDASLPGASALTFLQRLADGDEVDVPVFAHSTRKVSAAQERLMEAHARTHRVELLSSLDELRERVLLLLSGPAKPEPAASEPETVAVLAPAGGESGGPPGLHGRRVLLVDDDARNVLAIAGMLELHGMVVRHAPDGRKGIDALLADPEVDLILMDVMMPEMDGYTTTAAIREMPRFDRLPIIMVTAKAMAGDREKSLAAGASDYVTKPVEPGELLTCIGRWLPA